VRASSWVRTNLDVKNRPGASGQCIVSTNWGGSRDRASTHFEPRWFEPGEGGSRVRTYRQSSNTLSSGRWYAGASGECIATPTNPYR